MNKKKIAVAGIIVLLVAAYLVLDLGQYLSLDFFKARQADILANAPDAREGFFTVPKVVE